MLSDKYDRPFVFGPFLCRPEAAVVAAIATASQWEQKGETGEKGDGLARWQWKREAARAKSEGGAGQI